MSVPLCLACLLFEKEVWKNQTPSKFQGMQSLLMFKAQNVGQLILEDIFNVKKKMLLVTHRKVSKRILPPKSRVLHISSDKWQWNKL
jgi:hypothetical protein